ncbi:DeoR/GlpR family DNA-binding transcription regulator [Enterococcus olivae]
MSKNRKNEILDVVSRKKYISYSDLSELLFVSESTLRRDITDMYEKGLIQKVKGGIMALETREIEATSEIKQLENAKEKTIIAELSIDFIGNNQTIFLDSSTTSYYLAKQIQNHPEISGCTFITTSLISAPILSNNRRNSVYITGGKVLANRDSINGTDTCEYLEKCYFDIAFLSCRGISQDFGISEFSKEEAALKRIVSKNSNQKVLLVDNSKFNRKFPHLSISLPSLDFIVTNSTLSMDYKNFFFEQNIEVVSF